MMLKLVVEVEVGGDEWRKKSKEEAELTCHDMQALGLWIHHQVVKLSSAVTLSLGKRHKTEGVKFLVYP